MRQKLRATDFKPIFLLFMNTAPFLSQRTLSPRHIFLKFFLRYLRNAAYHSSNAEDLS